jgi:sugar (pentulose or hexulose) kinase
MSDTAAARIDVKRTFTPDPAKRAPYAKYLKLYKEELDGLHEHFKRIGENRD